jgi:hypothetical protein
METYLGSLKRFSKSTSYTDVGGYKEDTKDSLVTIGVVTASESQRMWDGRSSWYVQEWCSGLNSGCSKK